MLLSDFVFRQGRHFLLPVFMAFILIGCGVGHINKPAENLAIGFQAEGSSINTIQNEQAILVDYKFIDERSLEEKGMSFFQYASKIPAVAEIYVDENSLRYWFDHAVSYFAIGDFQRHIAIYSSYAEEENFVMLEGGGYWIPPFSGMNMPHSILVPLLNDIFNGVIISDTYEASGTGQIYLDSGTGSNQLRVQIDFDLGKIDPSLYTGRHGFHYAITVEDILDILKIYLAEDQHGNALASIDSGSIRINSPEVSEESIVILMNSDYLPVMRHEVLHALFSADRRYREFILDRVAESDTKQREMAVLFVASAYDVYDPDLPKVNPWLVIDEAFNAYGQEGSYDIESGHGIFSIYDYVSRYGITLDLVGFDNIKSLPVPDVDMNFINALYNDLHKNMLVTDEVDFLERYNESIFKNIYSMSFLLELIADQAPDHHVNIVNARSEFLDNKVEHLIDPVN